MPGRDYERKIDTAERDADAARLRAQGRTYDYIANALSYSHRGSARKAVQRALVATVREAGDELRVLELERLDRLLDVAWKAMQRTHVAHSQGRVVLLDGVPVLDDGPTLAAIDRVLKIMERRSKLLGLDVPRAAPIADRRRHRRRGGEVARLEREHAELDARNQVGEAGS